MTSRSRFIKPTSLLFISVVAASAITVVGCSDAGSSSSSKSDSADQTSAARPRTLKGTFGSSQDPLDAPLAKLTFDGAGNYTARRRLCRFPCEVAGTYTYDFTTGLLTLEQQQPTQAEPLRLRINFGADAGTTPTTTKPKTLRPQDDGRLVGSGDLRPDGAPPPGGFSACRLVGDGGGECAPAGDYQEAPAPPSASPPPPPPPEPGADREMGPLDVKSIKLLSNLKIPKAIVVAYRSRGQSDFIGEMACVAKEQGLRYVVVAKESQEADARAASGGKGCAGSVEIIKEADGLLADNDSVFIQDFAEILNATSNKGGGERLSVLSLEHPYFRPTLPKQVATLFDADTIRPPYAAMTVSGQMGGNIEGLPSGGVYVGDTMTEPLKGWITERAPETTVLESKWLMVGHIDEFVGIIPAKTSCGRSVVYADIPSALGLFATMSQPEFTAAAEQMKRECAAVRLSCAPTEVEFAMHGLAALKASITHFKRDAAKAPPFALTDFDLTKAPRAGAGQAATTAADNFIKNNLILYRDKVLPNAQRFTSVGDVRGGCSESEIMTPAPMLFHKDNNEWIADTGGVANFIVLRDRVVIPEAYFPSFRGAITTALTTRGVRPQFMNDSYYHFLQGEIHCGSQVVRDLTSDFRL